MQRLKNGVSSTHPLRGPELRALKQLRCDWAHSPYLFISERGGPMTASNVRKLVTRAGMQAKFAFPVLWSAFIRSRSRCPHKANVASSIRGCAIPNRSAAVDRSDGADRSRLPAAAGDGRRDLGSAASNCPLQRAGNQAAAN